jgi:hypothetical protein
MTPKKNLIICLHMSNQKAQNFTLISNQLRKLETNAPGKSFGRNFSILEIEKSANSKFFTLFLPVTFLLAVFLCFSQQF